MTFASLRILAVSPVSGYGGNNTSIHRIRALESLGCTVDVIDSTLSGAVDSRFLRYRLANRLFRIGLPIRVPDLNHIGSRLLSAMARQRYDLLWLERVLTLAPTVLSKLRDNYPETLIVGFSPDDMASRHNQTQQFLHSLPLYDIYLTTKTYNIQELQSLGCPGAMFIGNGYDPGTFRPLQIEAEDEQRLGGDVGFIGSYEAERAEMLQFLASQGLNVRVWGSDWQKMKKPSVNLRVERTPLFGDNFAKACRAFKINLGFLRKMNRDLQTTRSVEIPACGGFMLAERTSEHLDLFQEGKEAEFFDSRHELLIKCRSYLANPSARRHIADNGYQRCLTSGYSNAARLAAVSPPLLAKLHQKCNRILT
ncbi:conserved hypothetical protein [Thiocapsa sp. KS1]|nr:glycosyltransferase [Thiocapsa sp. KS1]CRI68140.1 conserved hypothetical protein [Thiocapsa sp. KS1]